MRKIFLVDLSKEKPIISNEFSPPLQYAKMMHVDWKRDSVIMRFEDHSKFIYKNGEIKMLDDGHLLRQAERDEENSFKDKIMTQNHPPNPLTALPRF
ncbi:hypothetical protein GTU79_28550 [Sodalis ligni]|uniref:hypothetical protein n=1 Tax=Sodalis ligni TaxID=2697027 RepID=UPI001BDEEBE2|nr:hypothetical protein [Sodalis ligni]QWA11035.1 hypothetical protein GTU79_28550 [Sodalis ligni]